MLAERLRNPLTRWTSFQLFLHKSAASLALATIAQTIKTMIKMTRLRRAEGLLFATITIAQRTIWPNQMLINGHRGSTRSMIRPGLSRAARPLSLWQKSGVVSKTKSSKR